MDPLTPQDLKRYQRHLVLGEVGEAGQQKLKAARVLIVGAGGLGSPSALYLAASGVGTLGLVDLDTVDVTNLQRQVLYSTADIGRGKTVAARERLIALNPELNVIEHGIELGPDNVMDIFRQYDIVLDGTDRIGTRYLVNDACVLLAKPLVSAAIHRFEGQAMTYVPGKGPCYRCLFPEPSTEIPNCATAGVLGVLPGVLGTLQATEAIKLIIGIGSPLVGRLLTYDALDLSFREFAFKRRLDCAVCGDAPTITSPTDADRPAGEVRTVSARELQARLRETAQAFTLVDVRDPQEFNSGHLPGARNIPVNDLESRLQEVVQYENVVFVCLSGKRSQAACVIALRGGLRAPGHLEGGMLAWREVTGDG
jgi:adenylyltransferase/sulfurtransferase